MNPFTKFICTICGHSDQPCIHWENLEIKKELRFLHSAVLEIIHLLFRPNSATLKLLTGKPVEFEGFTYTGKSEFQHVEFIETAKKLGDKMPASIIIGGTANSLFQEWTGPSGTGTVVPNAGAITYTSDNTAVATVDPSSGVATGVGEGTANITGIDQVNNLAASDVLTVTVPPPPPAQSATLQLTAV